jgi:hypothetical protein
MMNIKSLLTALTLAAGSICAHAMTINLESVNSSNGVPVALAAGDYAVQYVAGAWNPWGSGSSCTIPVVGCDGPTGWINYFHIWYDNNWHEFGTDGAGAKFFMTHEDAQAAGQAQNIQFTLGTAQTVEFAIRDSLYYDNSGTITLSMNAAPVPEPSGMVLMTSGLIGLIGLGRRRQVIQHIQGDLGRLKTGGRPNPGTVEE